MTIVNRISIMNYGANDKVKDLSKRIKVCTNVIVFCLEIDNLNFQNIIISK